MNDMTAMANEMQVHTTTAVATYSCVVTLRVANKNLAKSLHFFCAQKMRIREITFIYSFSRDFKIFIFCSMLFFDFFIFIRACASALIGKKREKFKSTLIDQHISRQDFFLIRNDNESNEDKACKLLDLQTTK